MQNKIAAAVVSFGLVLGMAAMTENSVMAQQATAAVQSDSKAGETQTVKAVQTNSKTIHVPAESQQAERKAPAENSKPQPAAAAETAKVFPVTEPVEGRTDVVAFTDAKNGFRVFVPSELEVYPLGINPVAVLRGENVAKGLRLAIDASAIDGKGPLMPFQVEAFREDFLRLVKNSVKDSANAKKILTSGEVELAGQKAVHVVSTNLTTDGKRRLLRDEYVFVTQNRMFVVMYMMDEKLYPEYQEKIPQWMESVQISQVWKKINIAGTALGTEVPASCIDLKEPTETERTMEVYGNESIMVGLVSYPREQFGFMPQTLGGLLNGRDCVKATYEVNGSKNESYTFVKDGKVIELGFVFKGENEKAVRPVIAHAVEKLEM